MGCFSVYELVCGIETLTGDGHFLVGYVVVIFHHLVDYASVGELYYAVGHGLDELMVV